MITVGCAECVFDLLWSQLHGWNAMNFDLMLNVLAGRSIALRQFTAVHSLQPSDEGEQ